MAHELEELFRSEQRLGAGALDAAPVAAHGFQGAARQLPAARALGEAAGVVVQLGAGRGGLAGPGAAVQRQARLLVVVSVQGQGVAAAFQALGEADRKSTRLNSSHVRISYAVFCLK